MKSSWRLSRSVQIRRIALRKKKANCWNKRTDEGHVLLAMRVQRTLGLRTAVIIIISFRDHV